MTKEDRNVMLENVSRQAYLMGLEDAPSIMGKRGREKQLIHVQMDNYELVQIDWNDVTKRVSRRVNFEFENEPNEAL